MNTNEIQPVMYTDAERTAIFKARIMSIEQAKKDGDVASAEFLAKELELHLRTEALIALYPSEHNPHEESAIVPNLTKIDLLEDPKVHANAFRLLQRKRIDQKGAETTYYRSTIEYMQVEDGRLPAHVAYVHGFDYKMYGHRTLPGVGAKESIAAVHGYKTQKNYEQKLAVIEYMIQAGYEITQ
jgi:hypothetical protein